MGEGRGSAMSVVRVLILLCSTLVFYCDNMGARAATYTVGDAKGWSFGVSSWPDGKSFVAGDTLVFNYNPSLHNVVVVDNAGYNACSAGPGAPVYNSGSDAINLPPGESFFICGFPGHCQGGMKIAVRAI